MGQSYDKLEELGIRDNTIIILMGDNGFYLSEHGMAGKWYAHEESIRVPLLIHDPRISEGGQKISNMTLNIDIAPTLLSLAGVDIPGDMQGKDLTQLYEEGPYEGEWRNEFFYEHTINIPTIPKSIGVIGEKYKFIQYTELESGLEEFYDRINDPLDKHNLINDEAYREIIGQYRLKLLEMQTNVK